MPSVRKGEKQGSYMKRCIPMLIKEGKSQDQAVAQCLNMFKEKWKAKGEEMPDEASAAFLDALANFDWDACPECVQRESDANHRVGIFNLDIPNKTF